MKQSAMFRMAMIAALILSQVTSQVALADSPTTAAASYATRYWLFDVTVQGSASGNGFQRTCQFVITQGISSPGTTNGRNPYDVALVCGSPWQRQERGAITYTTNTVLLGGAQQLDTATVSYSNSVIGITVDSRIAAGLLNVFTVNSGLLPLGPAPVAPLDLTFSNNNGVVDVTQPKPPSVGGAGTTLLQRCKTSPTCWPAYVAEVSRATTAYEGMGLLGLAQTWHSQIDARVLVDTKKELTNAAYAGETTKLMTWITNRPSVVRTQLGP